MVIYEDDIDMKERMFVYMSEICVLNYKYILF